MKMIRRFLRSTVILSLLTAIQLAAWSMLDTGPLERHLRALRAAIRRLSTRSFVTRYASGTIHEKFTVTLHGYSYAAFDASSVEIVEWSCNSRGDIQYESWYGASRAKERLQEDDRTVSYTSFYKSGQKWEQYTYNRQKRLKSYDVYDHDGKLIR